jgi:type IV pilus assembly protein PilV
MKDKSWVGNDAGFTLIEIMISLVILSIALIALAGLQVRAIKGNAFSKRMTAAVSMAESKIEQIKNSPYANIQSEAAAQFTQANINFTRQVAVTNNSPLPNTKTVNITVTWTDGSTSHTVPISTIVSQ